MYGLINLLATSLIILQTCKVSTAACDGECVPISCDKSKVLSGEERPIFDLRIQTDECESLLEVCCPKNEIVRTINPETHKNTSIKTCGVRHANGVGFGITGNLAGESQYGELPWTLLVLNKYNVLDVQRDVYMGSASLISPGVALTAAHILAKAKKNDIFVRAGEWDAENENELFPMEERRVSQVIIHEQFNSQYHNNIALLVFDKPLELLNDHISLVCLPSVSSPLSIDSTNCLTGGWGGDIHSRKNMNKIMKKVQVPLVNHTECQAAFRTTRLTASFVLDDSYVCAGGEENVDVCTGDGGAPLVCPGPNGIYYQYGIVAWGIECGRRGIPGAYTNVPMFTDWIEQKLRALPSNFV